MAETDAAQPVPLDEVDRNIIAELTRDGRMSVTQVAENVHISRAHAYTRIARLTGEGVLTKFTALVDPIKAGLKSSAYVTLKVRQHSWRELRELLRAIPEVHHIALVGGDFDVILLVRAVDNVGPGHPDVPGFRGPRHPVAPRPTVRHPARQSPDQKYGRTNGHPVGFGSGGSRAYRAARWGGLTCQSGMVCAQRSRAG